MTFDADRNATGVHAERYEFWLYRQIRKRLKSGELYLDDSLQHRSFTDELVSLEEKADVLSQMDIPWLRKPIHTQLDTLTSELHAQWLAFNRELSQGKLRVCLAKVQTQFASVFLSMAMRIMFSAVAVRISTSLLSLRYRPSHAKVRSTIQRFGRTAH